MIKPTTPGPSCPDENTDDAWKRTLWVMAVAQGLMMMAFTSSDTFLPLFIEQLGVHDLHERTVWSGVIFSSGFLMSAIVSPLWGSVADRKGRKLMVMRSTLAIALFTCLMGFTFSVWQLFAVRMLQGVFSGFSGAAIALVATKIPEERLGFALGWLASAAMVGSMIGPLAGGILVDAVHNYRVVFFLTSGFALLAFSITALFIKKDSVAANAGSNQPKLTLRQQFQSVRELKVLWTIIPVLFLAQFAVKSIQPVLPLFVKELSGDSAYLGTLAGFAIAVTGLAGLVASPILGKRGDMLGYRRMLTICMTGTALFFLPQALAPNIWVLLASRFGLGLFIGGILPAANALIAQMTPKSQRGRVFGFTSSATFLGSFAGPLFGGLASAAFGIRFMLLAVCVIYVLNVIWVRLVVQPPPLRSADVSASES
ncbi:MFS transporter [Paenibacillus abyssi]|uniref:MFS transporter n=1 Tax=Paenibacillus abyssi TaxID=1340531 RepID=A0A917FTI8_9BACL|nr:MFS transporter [Paenibacillus abyssi]GGG01879.1 MFS transporter [Paenibacillus abyssi]